MPKLVNIELNKADIAKLEKALQAKNDIRFQAVVRKNAVQMLNAARAGGTPVSTEETRPGGPHGELRKSSGVTGDEMGYSAEYAAHVEYGHRTKDGGFVPGQYYLKKNVDTQAFIYYQDLLNAIKKG